MTEERIRLWRKSVYAAILEIRSISWSMQAAAAHADGTGGWGGAGADEKTSADIRRICALTEWSHNIAEFSCRGFEGFNEARALSEADSLVAEHGSEMRGSLRRILRELDEKTG